MPLRKVVRIDGNQLRTDPVQYDALISLLAAKLGDKNITKLPRTKIPKQGGSRRRYQKLNVYRLDDPPLNIELIQSIEIIRDANGDFLHIYEKAAKGKGRLQPGSDADKGPKQFSREYIINEEGRIIIVDLDSSNTIIDKMVTIKITDPSKSIHEQPMALRLAREAMLARKVLGDSTVKIAQALCFLNETVGCCNNRVRATKAIRQRE